VNSTASSRSATLDGLRGVAVMGILLMNIFGFSMPSAAYFNPRAFGADTMLDFAVWSANFILIDGKMRALFSMLFGASMMLFVERVGDSGGDSMRLHLRRMLWLFVFGLLHFALVWDGDILTLYAVMGCIAFFWHWFEPRELIKLAIGFTLAGMLLWGSVFASFVRADAEGKAPNASIEAVEAAAINRATLGEPNSGDIENELDTFKSGYREIVTARALDDWGRPFRQMVSYGFETLGLMALGMGLFKFGFMTGGWSRNTIWRLVRWGYGIGLTGMAGLWLWCWTSGFEVMVTSSAVMLWSLPFRIPIMLGHAGLILLLLTRFKDSGIAARIEAVGQTAFTNYIGSSLVLTPIFYGYGLGLFGEVFRWEAALMVLPVWGLMLLWSQPWLARFRHGPLEWLWRCLTRQEWVPLRRG
jgi:uncharacterized protein